MLKYAVLISGGVLAATLVSAQTNCGPGLDPCPLSAPCCSEYGFCGIGAFCLGGCNPFWSNTVESCRAMPICENAEYTFEDLSTLVKHADFDGNSTAFAWTIDEGEPLTADGNNIALVLTEDNKGTKISSTKYVHYGTITARMRTGKWAGVVTAFITMSNVKDEIDLEWPGANVNEVQSNFFFQGNVDYVSGSNGGYHRDLSDTHLNYHDYTIDWQPETLRFLIDGQEVRSVSKESTLKDGKYEYPTTPARIQFSIWPAGIPDMPQGTVEWAGGMINWDDPDYVAWDNKFVALVEKVTVQCDDALPIGPKTVSYQYGANDTQGIPSVFATNETTLLNGASRFVAGLTGVNPYAFFSVAVGTVLGLMTL